MSIAAAPPGYVVSARPLTTGAALPSASQNRLVLYHTRSADGRDVVVSGAIAVPKGPAPPGGWPIVSWAHGTTGDAPECAPSHFAHMDIEQRMLDAWVARGYAVAQTDYEGIGTPGVHPYFVGAAAAHDVADIVRAARKLFPQIGDRWIAMGHSEGGNAALFTAALAPAWAPDLHLLGAVAFASGVNIADAVQSAVLDTQPSGGLPLQLMMVDGIAAADPSLRLSDILTPLGLARVSDLHKHCAGELMNDSVWQATIPASLFQHGPQLTPLFHDLMANDVSKLHALVPILMLHGSSDSMIPPVLSRGVANGLCANRATLDYRLYSGATHDTVMDQAQADALVWAGDRFTGKKAPSNCGAM